MPFSFGQHFQLIQVRLGVVHQAVQKSFIVADQPGNRRRLKEIGAVFQGSQDARAGVREEQRQIILRHPCVIRQRA